MPGKKQLSPEDQRRMLLASLMTTAGALAGIATYFAGPDLMGIWYFPGYAVAAGLWVVGYARLIRIVRSAGKPAGTP